MANTDARIDMTAGSITPKLFHLAWPLVVGNLLQTLYNLADMFWVGRVSAEAVAGVSLMFPLTYLFISTAMGLSAATVALISQHVGADNDRMADRVVAQTMLFAIAVSVVLAVGGFLGRHWILETMGARDQVFVEALVYIEVIFASLPLTFLFFAFRSSLRAAGDTKTAMWLMVISAGFNVVIDPFLILGWGPFPAWGTRGAAVATLISRLLATAVGLYILLRGDWGIQLHVGDLRPDPEILRQLFSVGYPATLDGWARSLAAVVMAALVAPFGTAPIAAYGIGVRLMSTSWTISGAIGQAAATGVGQNLGARMPERAAEVNWKGTGGTMSILFVIGGLVWIFPEVAMRIFIADPEVIAEGVVFLKIVALTWSFFGGLMVVQGSFRGAGNTKIAMALSLLSRWVFRVPLAVVLAFGWTVTVPVVGVTVSAMGLGVEGLWWSYAVGAVGSFVVGVLWFLRGTWTEGIVESPAAGETGKSAGGEKSAEVEKSAGGDVDPATGTELDRFEPDEFHD